MIGRYRLFSLDKEGDIHMFVADFDTYNEALHYATTTFRHGQLYTIKDLTKND